VLEPTWIYFKQLDCSITSLQFCLQCLKWSGIVLLYKAVSGKKVTSFR